MNRRRAVAFFALLTVGFVAVDVARADGSPKISEAQYAALARYSVDHDGRLSKAQVAQMQTRPDLDGRYITKVTPDYKMPGYVPDQGTLTKASALAATSTRSVDRYIVYEAGIFHTKVTDYHFVVAWSYNGRNVVGSPTSYTYLKNACGGCQNLGIVSNSQYPNYNSNGIYAWTVPLTGKWQWCGNGCQFFYPQVRFGVYFDGTYNYVVLSKG